MSGIPVVEARGVTKVYPSGRESLVILREVDLAVHAGEVVAIAGPSGSGKSTLLHMLGTLDRPTAGEVWIDGAPTASLSDATLAQVRNRTVGFVFQFHHLLPEFTAQENVQFPAFLARRGGSAVRERARALIERVGLADRGHHRPSELSGGERQRVAVARALFNEPRILLADEPSGDLDRNRAHDLHDLLLELARSSGVAVVVATHDAELAARADRQLGLHAGALSRI